MELAIEENSKKTDKTDELRIKVKINDIIKTSSKGVP
jgi:hypothetical protein